MADTTKKTEEAKPAEAPAAEDKMTPATPAVTAQKNMVIDDDGAEPMVVEPHVVKEEVAAQVMQPREGDHDKVNVHEVYVVTDRVITDPSSPLAVQVPAEGRGNSALPIHRLAEGTVEDKFAKADADAKK